MQAEVPCYGYEDEEEEYGEGDGGVAVDVCGGVGGRRCGVGFVFACYPTGDGGGRHAEVVEWFCWDRGLVEALVEMSTGLRRKRLCIRDADGRVCCAVLHVVTS